MDTVAYDRVNKYASERTLRTSKFKDNDCFKYLKDVIMEMDQNLKKSNDVINKGSYMMNIISYQEIAFGYR